MDKSLKVWTLLAPGPSLTQEQCDLVKQEGRCNILAVSDAYRLAPFADVLVANDAAWWHKRPDVVQFKGLKFTANPNVRVAKQVAEHQYLISRISNSGVLGMYVARNFGAKRILLVGFDMKGSHFFGAHKDGLKNTTPDRYKVFMTYFAKMADLLSKENVEVFNCTEGSALECFPRMTLKDALCLKPL